MLLHTCKAALILKAPACSPVPRSLLNTHPKGTHVRYTANVSSVERMRSVCIAAVCRILGTCLLGWALKTRLSIPASGCSGCSLQQHTRCSQRQQMPVGCMQACQLVLGCKPMAPPTPPYSRPRPYLACVAQHKDAKLMDETELRVQGALQLLGLGLNGVDRGVRKNNTNSMRKVTDVVVLCKSQT
jgi:hypothetical protein